MRIRPLALAALAVGLMAAGSALAQDQAATTSAQPAAPAEEAQPRMTADEPRGVLGEKEYKERINVVARKPLRHDIGWLDSHDRSSWGDFTVWHGIRDERPLVARKTVGFHEPKQRRTRFERVLLIGRGPLRGPAPAE